jgi:hypothetical protein
MRAQLPKWRNTNSRQRAKRAVTERGMCNLHDEGRGDLSCLIRESRLFAQKMVESVLFEKTANVSVKPDSRRFVEDPMKADRFASPEKVVLAKLISLKSPNIF